MPRLNMLFCQVTASGPGNARGLLVKCACALGEPQGASEVTFMHSSSFHILTATAFHPAGRATSMGRIKPQIRIGRGILVWHFPRDHVAERAK
jgi:hypothetical protein